MFTSSFLPFYLYIVFYFFLFCGCYKTCTYLFETLLDGTLDFSWCCCCCYMLIICFILWLNLLYAVWDFLTFFCVLDCPYCLPHVNDYYFYFYDFSDSTYNMISWFHDFSTHTLTHTFSLSFILHFTSHLQYGFSDIGTLRCPNIVWIWKCTEIKANIAIVRNFIDMLLLYQDHHAESRLANEGKSTHVSTYNNIIFILYL